MCCSYFSLSLSPHTQVTNDMWTSTADYSYFRNNQSPEVNAKLVAFLAGIGNELDKFASDNTPGSA